MHLMNRHAALLELVVFVVPFIAYRTVAGTGKDRVTWRKILENGVLSKSGYTPERSGPSPSVNTGPDST